MRPVERGVRVPVLLRTSAPPRIRSLSIRRRSARHLVRLVSSNFRLNMRKHPWKKCPFSGMTDDLWLVKPIPDLPDDVDEMQVRGFTSSRLHPSSRAQVACTESQGASTMAAGNGLPYWQWCWQLDHLIVGSCRTRVRGNSRNWLYAPATL